MLWGAPQCYIHQLYVRIAPFEIVDKKIRISTTAPTNTHSWKIPAFNRETKLHFVLKMSKTSPATKTNSKLRLHYLFLWVKASLIHSAACPLQHVLLLFACRPLLKDSKSCRSVWWGVIHLYWSGLLNSETIWFILVHLLIRQSESLSKAQAQQHTRQTECNYAPILFDCSSFPERQWVLQPCCRRWRSKDNPSQLNSRPDLMGRNSWGLHWHKCGGHICAEISLFSQNGQRKV